MTEYVMEYDGWAEGIPAGEYLKVCSAMHARKREEIVRCRDCSLCVEKGYRLYCDRDAGGFPEVEPYGFCAWGERK